MLITVSDIAITGKHYDFDFDTNALQIDEKVKIKAPVHFVGDVFKSNQDVRITARVTTKVEIECSRCLEPCILPMDMNFEVFYRPHPHNLAESADIPFGELGILYYEDNTCAQKYLRSRLQKLHQVDQ